MIKRTLLLAAALMLTTAVAAFACSESSTATPAQKASIASVETAQEMTIKGQLVCMGCTLKADG